jgi:pyruvate/2-oxoglutarate dehydrogenase complex dihydrolipoamide acyltransferase (E2) component
MMGSVENARLLHWFIEEGASFSRGDLLYELETDKTVTEVEADADGVLVRRLAAEGDEFKMGDRVGLQAPAGTGSAEIAAALAAMDGGGPAADAGPKSSVPTGAVNVKSSPRSRKLAREHGVDITTLTGTGPRGRITGEDVLKAASGTGGGPVEAATAPQVEKPPAFNAPAAGVSQEAKGQIIPHSLRRKTIARNMAATKREVPHLTADMDIDLSGLIALRKRYQANGQPAPSILAFFATSAARLLMDHRHLNATFRDNDTILWDTVGLNIGVDTEEGLVVPIIRDAQLLTAAEMTTQIARLAARARDGSLAPSDMSGGTFTISNPGALGPVVRAEAVLNGPQVALLGMPGIVNKPVAVEMADGSFAIQVRPIIRAGITFDHRALDGGPVIRFLNALKFAIENINS